MAETREEHQGDQEAWPDESERTNNTRLACGTLEIPRQNLRTTDSLCGDDIAQIAHDLRSPVSTIALETMLLAERFAEGVRTDVDAALARIRHNTEFLERMIGDLLDTCVLEAGRLVLTRQRTELKMLLEHIIERAIATRDRNRVFLQAARAVTLDIDDLRIERVVANLLTNALKFSPKCGAVVVRLELELDHACVSVIDTGPGIREGEADHIFEKHRRGEAGYAQRGHGLGLFISRAIVEAHGGRIGVDSIRGAGTRFFFTLPL